MAAELFVDTSGFYALLARRDTWHQAADRLVRKAGGEGRRLLTTDYVLVEAANLLKARGLGHLTGDLFDRVFHSTACRMEWLDAERFHRARTFFQKHTDQSWSFTDCSSFCVMKELRLRDALTSDAHFEQAGFVVLLR
jgi:predicted nucleic acid-binding protein